MANIDTDQVRRVLHRVVDIFAAEIIKLLNPVDKMVFPLAIKRLHNGIDNIDNDDALRRIAIQLVSVAKDDEWFRELLIEELGIE